MKQLTIKPRHPLLHYLYYDATIMLSRASGYERASELIEEFRAGEHVITVEGGSKRFQDLPPEKQANFTIEKLHAAQVAYRESVEAYAARDTRRRPRTLLG